MIPFVILLGIGIFVFFLIKNRKKISVENYNIEEIYNIYKNEINKSNGEKYIDYYWEEFLYNLFNPDKIKKCPKEFKEKYKELKSWRDNLVAIREENNEKYVEDFFINKKDIFKNIEGNPLDNQQIEAIIRDEICNLVIAGAGSGKTTTIIGKIKYLVEEVGINPSEILAICYNNSAAKELKERIKEQGYEVETYTFHKLGLDIIKESNSSINIFNDEKLDDVIEECIKEQMENSNKVMQFFTYYLNPSERDEFDIEGEENLEEYKKEINNVALMTLKGELVRSYEEVMIANYLFVNDIEYEYEKFYEVPNGMQESYFESFFKQKNIYYRPDFYLPKYDIYIEHFALDENGKTPSFWSIGDPKAQEKYLNGIKWKRKIHKMLKTKLLETYSYYRKKGVLQEKIKEMLEKEGVEFKPLTSMEIIEKIRNTKSNVMYTKFIKLLKSFIVYIKQNDIKRSDMLSNLYKFQSDYKRKRAEVYIDIVLDVLQSYQSYLEANNEIDFSDMIVKSKQLLEEHKVRKNYKYVIIDEFQDISKNRYELVENIVKANKGKIFCVGDDWQSIYGFAGSDLSLFLNINNKMPYGIKTYIEKTYRYPQSIANLAGNFIMKNEKQIKKNIKSHINDIGEGKKAYEAIYYDKDKESFKTKHRLGAEILRNELEKLPIGATVLLLVRYNLEIVNFLGEGLQSIKEFNGINIKFNKRPDLKISFKTVHKSKGLQSDYVFILNNRNGLKDGFPSKVEDDELYKLIKDQGKENYEFAEERRLYYVAMTRTKKKLYFIICSDEESSFVKEIEINWKTSKKNVCSKCGGTKFYIRDKNIYCKECDNEISEKDLDPEKKCPRCGNDLKYGKKNTVFLKCSGFPKCDYMEKSGLMYKK